MLLPPLLRFRYTLRALLVFITLFCLWCGYHGNQASAERTAAAFLREHGAEIWQGPSSDDESVTPYRAITGRFFRELQVTRLEITTSMDRDTVRAICSLPYLSTLRVEAATKADTEQTAKRDCRLLPLTSFDVLLSSQQITTLSLAGWKLKDSDENAIACQKSIRKIKFFDCDIPGSVLKAVLSRSKLHSLTLDRCQIQFDSLDGALAPNNLAEFTSIHSTCDDSLSRLLRRTSSLRKVELWGPTVHDSFIDQLRGHPHLERLYLVGTRVTKIASRGSADFPSLQDVLISPRDEEK